MDMQAQTMVLDSTGVTMAGFADTLTNVLQMGGAGGNKQVVDQTGLKGKYEVSVELSLSDLIAMARAQGINVPMPPPGGGAGSGWRLSGSGVRPRWRHQCLRLGEKTRPQARTQQG